MKIINKKRKISDSESKSIKESKKAEIAVTWSKLTKKERKKVHKQQKPNYDMNLKAKKIWNNLRKHDTTRANQVKWCQEISELLKGNLTKIIYTPDMSRVIESIVKYGETDTKDEIFDELKVEINYLAKCKYAVHFLRQLFKSGSKSQKNHLINELSKDMRNLIKTKISRQLLEFVYTKYTNSHQKKLMLGEFYGKRYKIFNPDCKKNFSEIIENKEYKEILLKHLHDRLVAFSDNDHILGLSFIHKLFRQYLLSQDDENLTLEIIEKLRDKLETFLNSNDGIYIAMKIFWHSKPKERKIIVKSMKSKIVDICLKDSYLIIICILDALDDTALIKKQIAPSINDDINKLFDSQYGRRIISYILSPRNPKFINPQLLELIKSSYANSKKDRNIKCQELADIFGKSILQCVLDNLATFVELKSHYPIITALIDLKNDESKLLFEKFSNLITENPQIIKHDPANILLKKIISDTSNDNFIKALIDDKIFSEWLKINRGCHIISLLMKNNNKKVKKIILKHKIILEESANTNKFAGAINVLSLLDCK